MNLHPGAATALRMLDADELAVARMMAAGDVASPQHCTNVWLYCMRVTGTGVSYRPKWDEFVYRRPENYLTDEFLARCNGLPVIFRHPEKSILDSEEFSDRIVGTVMLPFIRGDEVWCIAKIFDAGTVQLLHEKQMSTSPAVLLGSGVKLKSEDGSTIFVEDKPTLLDHLAICEHGVWDKGEEASGIEANIRGDTAVADEDKEKEAERDDGIGAKLDGILKGMDSLRSDMASCNSRMDAFEKEPEERTDKRRKDDDDDDAKGRKDAKRKDDDDDDEERDKKEEEKETEAPRLAADKSKRRKDDDDDARKDARADSIDDLRKQLESQSKELETLRRRVPRDVTDADYSTVIGFQARADAIYNAHGGSAPRPLGSEAPMNYRLRLVDDLKRYSPKWKDKKLGAIATDEAFFSEVESQVYADAIEAARNPQDIPDGDLRCVTRKLPSGHTVNEYHGQPRAWMDPIAGPVRQFATKFNLPGSAR